MGNCPGVRRALHGLCRGGPRPRGGGGDSTGGDTGGWQNARMSTARPGRARRGSEEEAWDVTQPRAHLHSDTIDKIAVLRAWEGSAGRSLQPRAFASPGPGSAESAARARIPPWSQSRLPRAAHRLSQPAGALFHPL